MSATVTTFVRWYRAVRCSELCTPGTVLGETGGMIRNLQGCHKDDYRKDVFPVVVMPYFIFSVSAELHA